MHGKACNGLARHAYNVCSQCKEASAVKDLRAAQYICTYLAAAAVGLVAAEVAKATIGALAGPAARVLAAPIRSAGRRTTQAHAGQAH
jgi:hypothetical protein